MNKRRFLLLIFSIALVIRLVAVFIYSDYLIPAADAKTYDKTAISILNGKGIADLKGNPTSTVPPLYPIFLSIIYFIFGHSYIAVRIIQSILSSFICVFLYYIGKNIFGEKEGRLASSISVIFPSFVIFSYYGGPGFLITESLFILILAGIILYISKIEYLNYFNCIFIGIMTGLLILTKFNGIFLPLIITLHLLVAFNRYGKKQMCKFLFILFTFLFLTLSPWIVRNYLFSHKVSLLHSAEMPSWLSVILRQSPDLETEWSIKDEELKAAIHQGEGYIYLSKKWNINEKAVNSEIRKKIFYEILPKRLNINYLFKNMKIFWSPYYNTLKSYHLIKFNFSYVFLIPFSLFGIYFSIFKKNKKAIFLLGSIIGLFFFHLLIGICDERYRLPIEPILIVYAVFGFFSLLKIFSKPKQRAAFFSFIAIFFIMNVVAYLNSDFTVKWLSNIIP